MNDTILEVRHLSKALDKERQARKGQELKHSGGGR